MELRRQHLIQELQKKGFYRSSDGRLLNELTLEELEKERIRLPKIFKKPK
ncbi:Fur-regulated basic protein FbpA [Alteribacillus bidgolensis]|uniref:Fur-regulated basic protein A n=1 Tax=Alteribacillus bidgolensis TaxID=930129 RepID=A0A1G8P633_9BACI|nr:Fur-regulated basic protein FbpA [Alteribacillus bidgolensis]SDI87748.1 Fur-regulated basic protein A [Alteribacillus bidgolensis]